MYKNVIRLAANKFYSATGFRGHIKLWGTDQVMYIMTKTGKTGKWVDS
jgi:hypothetical protein